VRVHHLNCGTMRPPSRRFVNSTGSPFEAGRLVCHCLLAETDAGLVLVDTGIGLADIADPAGALGTRFLRQNRPVLDAGETAIRQVTRLGYRPADVRHLVVTHLDRDHASGIADFPWATVHVHASEHQAALTPQTPREQARYRPRQWAHGPRWATYGQAGGRDGSVSTASTRSMGSPRRSCWCRAAENVRNSCAERPGTVLLSPRLHSGLPPRAASCACPRTS
jgi:glyoxylase-like metal-dependent hydrolase (beta-lactamase superfamily II)